MKRTAKIVHFHIAKIVISNPHTGNTRGASWDKDVLTSDEVEALVGACARRSPCGVRNRALIMVLFRGMLRVQEALDLQIKDLDPKAMIATIHHGKGDKSRTVGLRGAWADLDRWIDLRREMGIFRTAPIFCTVTATRKGLPLSTAYVRAVLPRLAKKAGIEKRVHAHALRRSGATLMIDRGHSIRIVGAGLGHSRSSTTEHYIARAISREVVAAMNADE